VRATRRSLPLTQVRPGRSVVRQGEPYPDAWVVRSGHLRMEMLDVEGRRLTIDILGPGDLVGGPPGWIADATVRAMTGAWLAPAGPVALRDGLVRRAHRAAAFACSLAWDRVPDRIVGRFDDLAERFGHPIPGGRSLLLALTQDDIADLAGTTRETVNRALAELGRQGRIVGGGDAFVVRTPISPGGDRLSPRLAGGPTSTSCSNVPDRSRAVHSARTSAGPKPTRARPRRVPSA
jgi:CRP/FNR family cyclic AMP-dependent transcriptional regulator